MKYIDGLLILYLFDLLNVKWMLLPGCSGLSDAPFCNAASVNRFTVYVMLDIYFITMYK